jgi:hypothetical protein
MLKGHDDVGWKKQQHYSGKHISVYVFDRSPVILDPFVRNSNNNNNRYNVQNTSRAGITLLSCISLQEW